MLQNPAAGAVDVVHSHAQEKRAATIHAPATPQVQALTRQCFPCEARDAGMTALAVPMHILVQSHCLASLAMST